MGQAVLSKLFCLPTEKGSEMGASSFFLEKNLFFSDRLGWAAVASSAVAADAGCAGGAVGSGT